MNSWGLNTLGDWTHHDFYRSGKVPYTIEITRARLPKTAKIPGFSGMADFFASDFEAQLTKNAQKIKWAAEDPYCIGIFINNEMRWGNRTTVARSSFASPATQPAKQAMVDFLKCKYIVTEGLNRKWGTSYRNWDEVLKSTTLPDEEKSSEDMLEFSTKFFEHYYSTCRKVVKAFSPHMLYLGSRLHLTGMPELFLVASKYCDVLAINCYSWSMDGFTRQGLPKDKPILISEFHFGLLDRGMFNADSRPAGVTQADRAHAYLRLMQGLLLHPQVVGAHWFCYRDEPVTGRWSGIKNENFAIGLVDNQDTPYYELTGMMRKVAENGLDYRLKGEYNCDWDGSCK